MNNDKLCEAYKETVAKAAKEGKADFMCCSLTCDDCPFHDTVGHCTDETVDGAGRKRTVEEWREWWHELTGEDTADDTAEDTTGEHTGESTVSGGEDIMQPTVSALAVSALAVSAPNVDIIWTTAAGYVKHRAGPIALLDGEMRQFSKDLGVWISEMSKPNTSNSFADSIMFVARDETGAVLANVELFAEMFGKRKVWVNTTRTE